MCKKIKKIIYLFFFSVISYGSEAPFADSDFAESPSNTVAIESLLAVSVGQRW